ncbi:MAG: response regulator [bacterium]
MDVEPKRILVFEDELPVRTLVEEILSAAGYSVTSTGRGMDVFTLVRQQPPDLIVSDLTVPGLNGYQIIAMLRRSGSYQGPILVLSGRTSEEDAKAALEAGAQAYLKKPVRRVELLAAVAELLAPPPA